MTKRYVMFLNAILALFVAIWGGIIALFLSALVYLAAGELAADFHKTIFNPTMAMATIVYIVEVVAIAIWVYLFLERRSRRCITA